MKSNLATLGALATVVMLGIGGCGVMGKADAPIILRIAPVFPAAGKLDSRSVAVAAVDAVGEAAKSRYAYVDPARPGEINQAKSLFWEQPPPHVVERALVAGLRTRFASVTGPEVAAPADIRVLAMLDRFEELSAEPGQAVIAFEATVIDHGKVARTGKWCASAPFAGPGPSDRARAFEVALIAAVTAFAQDLATGAPARSDGSC